MTDEYKIDDETMEAEEPRKSIEEESSELMDEFAEVRRKVMSNTGDMEEKRQLEMILDMIEELLVKETDTIIQLHSPECGQWIYEGEDDELQKFTFTVLMNELRMCTLLANFDKMAESLDEPYESSAAKLAVRVACITLRIAMENLHLTIHTAYKQECEKRMRDEQKE